MILGVNIANDASKASADCALAASLGAKWVRVSIEQSDSHAIGDLTTIVAAARSHGLNVLQTCQPIGHVQPKTQQQIDTYAEHVVECASIASATGRDNENNGYGSNETPDPKTSAASMVAVIEQRDKHDRHALLVTDELCPGSAPVGSPLSKGFTDPLLFFEAMIDAQPTILRAPHLWIGWHGYGGFGHDPGEAADWNTCYRQRALDELIRSRNGGKGRPIVSTEFGQPTGPAGYPGVVSLTDQGHVFDQYMLERRRQHAANVAHGSAPWIWYTLRDRAPSGSKDWAAVCGLVDVHGQQKPVALRFAAAARLAA